METLSDDAGLILPPILIVVGLVGIVVPILPGLLLVLAGVLVWAISVGSVVSWTLFGLSVLVAVAGATLQYLVPGKRMRRAGVERSTLALAVVLGIVGFFVIPGVGAIVGFVLGIYLVETGRSRDRAQAWQRTKQALVAVAQSIGIELLAGVVIAWFYVVGLVIT